MSFNFNGKNYEVTLTAQQWYDAKVPLVKLPNGVILRVKAWYMDSDHPIKPSFTVYNRRDDALGFLSATEAVDWTRSIYDRTVTNSSSIYGALNQGSIAEKMTGQS